MKRHVCPWWIGYLLASPLRRLRENPDNILTNHVADGMTVMDYGSAMGFFSLPAAKLAGPTGKVICVDIQERMLAALRRRAQKHNMSGRITTVLADEVQSLDTYAGSCDCILAIHVLHEVPDQRATFSLFRKMLKPHGRVLFVEPPGHVSRREFEASLERALEFFDVYDDEPVVPRAHSALFINGRTSTA